MADPTIVTEWLEKAHEDFLFADANLREGSEFYAQLCFHFQQAAEKYLKAYIIGKERRNEQARADREYLEEQRLAQKRADDAELT